MSNRAHRARRDLSEGEILHALEVCGYRWKKLAQKGVPDVLAWKPGKIVLIECKSGKAKLRETQQWAEIELDVLVFRCAEDVFSWHQGRPVKIARS